MEKFEKILLNIGTGLCVLILSLDITCFSLKKISEKYLKTSTIREVVSNVDITELFKDESGKEIEQITKIKDDFVISGIPTESVDAFISSKKVHELTGDIVANNVDNILNDKKNNIDAEYIYNYLEDNMDDISKELQDKNVPKSELLTPSNQEEILKKLKDKMPSIEEKVNEIIKRLEDKVPVNKIKFLLKVSNFLYKAIFDLILILVFMIFVYGIIITRKSIYKSLKWIGISFLLSSVTLLIVAIIIPKFYRYMDKLLFVGDIINESLKTSINTIKTHSLICLIIYILFLVINTIIYIYLVKHENKKINSI